MFQMIIVLKDIELNPVLHTEFYKRYRFLTFRPPQKLYTIYQKTVFPKLN